MRLFDEINSLSEDEIFNIDTYFDEMELTKEEKKERKESMNEIMLFIFALFLTMREYGYLNKQYIVNQLETRYSKIVLKYIAVDELLNDYIKTFSEEIIDTTLKYPDESYYISDERAAIVAVNESNSILGYKQLQMAKEQGYTKKQWITEKDKRVRKTHREVDGEVIDIDRLFLVGDSLMAYPHDLNAPPEETANCRCSLIFS